MTSPLCLFFDFDDTLSEQIPFNLQYVRAIGSTLAPRFGGDTEAWAKCAIDMLETLEAQYIARFCDDPTGYNAWFATMHAQAMELVFSGMALPVPPDAEALSQETQRLALAQCNALFPGTLETVHALHTQGYTLHMASGNDSGHLRAALTGAQLDACFDRLYGPDLIDCAKEGPEYYVRLFRHIQINPARALIIDNDPNAIGWAISTGAQAVQVDFLPYKHVPAASDILARITDIAQLPELVRSLFTDSTNRHE
jgi:FMN phosphatase YigB (HAD superfamily)